MDAARLPSLTIGDVIVDADTQIPATELTLAFPEVAIRNEPGREWRLLREEFAEQYQKLAMLLPQELGLSEQGHMILRGLEPQVWTVRKLCALQKTRRVCDDVRARLKQASQNKAVIFARHKAALSWAESMMRGFGPKLIYPGSNPLTIQKRVRAFQRDPKARVLLLDVRAGQKALDLSAADRVYFIECSWLAHENAAAMMRVHHANQRKPVTAYWYMLADSIDSYIMRAMRLRSSETLVALDRYRHIVLAEAENRAIIDPFG